MLSGVAPIWMRTIPLAVLSGQDGAGLETLMLTVLPLGEFSAPETHVLLQPAAHTKQAISRSNVDAARESRR